MEVDLPIGLFDHFVNICPVRRISGADRATELIPGGVEVTGKVANPVVLAGEWIRLQRDRHRPLLSRNTLPAIIPQASEQIDLPYQLLTAELLRLSSRWSKQARTNAWSLDCGVVAMQSSCSVCMAVRIALIGTFIRT